MPSFCCLVLSWHSVNGVLRSFDVVGEASSMGMFFWATDSHMDMLVPEGLPVAGEADANITTPVGTSR